MKKHEKKPKYWVNHLRVIGLRRRGGSKTYLKFLPPKLCKPGSRPPPLENEELRECGLLRRATKKSVIFTYGAQAYSSVIREDFRGKLIHRHVSHVKHQFTKAVRTPKGRSKIAGTESIDSVWGTLTKSVPSTLHTKVNGSINPLLYKYVWSWLYRLNRKNQNGYKHLAEQFQ